MNFFGIGPLEAGLVIVVGAALLIPTPSRIDSAVDRLIDFIRARR